MTVAHKRIVPNTNVVISSFLFPGSPPALCLGLAQTRGRILASSETLAELSEVLLRPKFDGRLSRIARARLLIAYRAILEMIDIDVEIQACRDSHDDKFLSLAVSGQADLILTGDADLLVLHPFRGITILSPADYLRS